MKLLPSILFFFLSLHLSAQEFYDLNTIQSIDITFTESNWDQLLDAQASGSGDYILAQSVAINGEVYDSVGVKYKGNSTYNANQIKNPFHIELDTYKDHDHQGYTDIKLSNVAKDPSFLREVLSYEVLRKYMHGPLSNYANVTVNGTLIGLYSNSEAISKKFVKDRFGSKKNTFIKCNPPDGAGPQTNDLPSLEYIGTDSTAYYDAYELKSDIGWAELIDLCNTLANNIQDIEDILDVDRALWMLAYDNVLVNLDSYIGSFQQNYYLYRQDNGRFAPVVWDLNESFGRFAMTGSGNLNSTSAKQQLSHLLHATDASFPLIQKLLAVPTYKRMYLAHYKTILLENFDNEAYYEVGLELQNTISAAVQADNNKFFTYNNFIDNLTADINGGPGPGGGATPGITNLMDGRNSYLMGLSDFTQIEPTINNIELSSTSPIINEPVSVLAEITNVNAAFLGYRIHEEDRFVKVEMLDDGMNNDGTAGDGVFGATILVENAYVQYYIFAENDNAGLFSPRRAEHEFHNFTATTSNPSLGDLVINEFLASNKSVAADTAGEFDDWIEFYNNGSTVIELEGYFLSDDATDIEQWSFPEGANIAPDGYLIVWADKDEDQDGLHANFKLSADAESIFLADPSGEILDEVSYVNQVADISYGRFENGSGDFQSMTPTFGAENSDTTPIINIDGNSVLLKAYPNPISNLFYIEVHGDDQQSQHDHLVEIYDLNGRLIYEITVTDKVIINASDWVAGIYIAKVEDAVLKLVVK